MNGNSTVGGGLEEEVANGFLSRTMMKSTELSQEEVRKMILSFKTKFW